MLIQFEPAWNSYLCMDRHEIGLNWTNSRNRGKIKLKRQFSRVSYRRKNWQEIKWQNDEWPWRGYPYVSLQHIMKRKFLESNNQKQRHKASQERLELLHSWFSTNQKARTMSLTVDQNLEQDVFPIAKVF